MKQQLPSQASRASPASGSVDSDAFALAAARLDQERPLRNRRLQKIAGELRKGGAEGRSWACAGRRVGRLNGAKRGRAPRSEDRGPVGRRGGMAPEC